MAYVVMAYTVMAYIVMAYIVMHAWLPPTRTHARMPQGGSSSIWARGEYITIEAITIEALTMGAISVWGHNYITIWVITP